MLESHGLAISHVLLIESTGSSNVVGCKLWVGLPCKWSRNFAKSANDNV